ncbi:MAG: hypothetical protein HDT38_07595 [Clostridiales bacterium]|nr:hypothetical protein [Clostridiales bacterium]
MNKVRYKYLDAVCDLIREGKNMALVSSDYAAPVLDDFRKTTGERYVSVGIAEQNLIQIACGLSLSGQRAIAYGLAPFPCIRTVDQIRNAAAMMKLPISIVSAGVGFAIPEFGATHYCVEDVSIMRTIPGLKIINLTDEVMAEKAAQLSLTTDRPLYIRIDKYSDGIIYGSEDIDFERGFSVVKDGGDIAIIASGYYTNRMMKLSQTLSEYGINAKVIDLYALPFDTEKLIAETAEFQNILTIEEHVREGGIGSAVLEAFSDKNVWKNIKRMGIDFGGGYTSEFGSREYFIKKYHLDDSTVIKEIKETVR